MLDLDWLISVDDHVIEPANVWQDRVPAKFKDVAPKLVSDDDMDYWEFNGRRAPTSGLSVAAGRKKEEFSPLPMSYRDMRDGCYDSLARLDDMNRAGVLASLCFPSFPRFCGQAFSEIDDAELGMACIRAYNDWMIEEWCGSAPGRYIPLVIIPLRDPAAAAVEMARCAAMGVHAFAFSENCEPLGLPTIHDKDGYWDPVMQAANDLEMVVCMHVGSSSTLPRIAHDTPDAREPRVGRGAHRRRDARLALLRLLRPHARTSRSRCRRATSAGSRTSSNAPSRSSTSSGTGSPAASASPRTTARWAGRSRRSTTSTCAPASVTTCSAASSTTCTGSPTSPPSARTT